MLNRMRQFSTSSLTRKPSEVLSAARSGGAILTRHGRKDFVILPMAEYQHFLRKQQADAPAEDASMPED